VTAHDPEASSTLVQFDFGENWKSFSASALKQPNITAARVAFRNLFANVPLEHRSFLDIGSGQGLGVCLAQEAGALVHACDINPKCMEAMVATGRFFPTFSLPADSIVVGSILEKATVEKLRVLPAAEKNDGFDVVQSWGVLHHTGDMRMAMQNAASLVRPGGHFVIAIYNKHWSSPAWRVIKRCYVAAPALVRRLIVMLFIPLIAMAKFLVTGKNPFRQERGMDFYHDIVDWVGGYPYEYASAQELTDHVESLGFKTLKVISARVPTGCNEFVFRREEAASRPK
jgi:SAM-dependent methyltransferase